MKTLILYILAAAAVVQIFCLVELEKNQKLILRSEALLMINAIEQGGGDVQEWTEPTPIPEKGLGL